MRRLLLVLAMLGLAALPIRAQGRTFSAYVHGRVFADGRQQTPVSGVTVRLGSASYYPLNPPRYSTTNDKGDYGFSATLTEGSYYSLVLDPVPGYACWQPTLWPARADDEGAKHIRLAAITSTSTPEPTWTPTPEPTATPGAIWTPTALPTATPVVTPVPTPLLPPPTPRLIEVWWQGALRYGGPADRIEVRP